MTDSAEKIQKVLARTGYGSRREVERWIASGRLKVDGRLAVLGDRISAANKVSLDDKQLFLSWELYQQRVLAYYKPEGEICSRHDPDHKKTIFDHLPNLSIGRWIAAGRLDINTTGLILLSNDGQLINRLMHPSHEIEREYAVRVLGEVNDDIINNLKQGVMLEDGLAKFDNIKFSGGEGANRWYHVVLKEGRNREVRRLWESQGLMVSRLSRIRFGNISLQRGQKQGKFRDLEHAELKQLYQSVGLKYQSLDKGAKGKLTKSPSSKYNKTTPSKRIQTNRGKLLTPKRLKNKKRS